MEQFRGHAQQRRRCDRLSSIQLEQPFLIEKLLMSCNTNEEIMESLFEQVQEEYPDLTIEQQATIASQRFWNLAQ